MTEQELREQIDAITRGPSLIVAAVKGMDPGTLRHKPDPKKWCVLEILGHLADIEVLYGYRMRQMIADAQPTIAPIDQDDWARNLGYMEATPEELLEAYLAARLANLRLLRRLKPADLAKAAFHPEHKREVTLAELIGMMAGHDANHARQIQLLRQSAAANHV
jgi:DinB superfamily